jgi:hypothetical protein
MFVRACLTVACSVEADATGALQFLAIEAPAFTPDDYVRVAH